MLLLIQSDWDKITMFVRRCITVCYTAKGRKPSSVIYSKTAVPQC